MGKNGFAKVTKKLLAINPCSPPAQFRHAPGGDCNKIQQAQHLQAIPCLGSIIPSPGVLSRIANAKGPISHSRSTEFLR